MVTREEKNKVIQKEILKEKSLNHSKTLLKIVLLMGIMFVIIYLDLRFIATSFIKTKEYIIENSNLPNAFNGVKILHFSDLLYGSTIAEDDLTDLSKEFAKIKPDIVVFTGDIIDRDYNLSKDELNSLKTFFSDIPYTIGKYSVKGDYDTTTFDLIMNEASFTILDNTYELLYYNDNTPIALIGLNSNDLDISNIDNEELVDLYKISIIHNYDNYNKTLTSNVVFAGHNLNGEIYIPFYKGILGNNQYNGRFYQENGYNVYISNGLGSIHKLRMFNHPSINVYRLIND